MATLKEHQAAMVDLLANGSGIPASASRLAHAMHDVLSAVLLNAPLSPVDNQGHAQETTPGLNDKALSKREKPLKTDSPAKWPTPAEQRVKELENTIRQLKANNAKLREDISCYQAIEASLTARINNIEAIAEQAGCRKEDTQVCDHVPKSIPPGTDGFPDGFLFCERCGENLTKGFLDKEREAIKLGCELGGYFK